LSAVLAAYAEAGFDGELRIDGEDVQCLSCGTLSDPAGFALQSLRRLEGASDPADMAAVLALTCPSCGRGGALVVRFGPEASAAEAQLLHRVRDERFHGPGMPDSSAPWENGPASGDPGTSGETSSSG
jgi:hypothetical protein